MSLPYDFDDDIKRIKAISAEPGLRNVMLALDEKEFNRLGYAARSLSRVMKDIEKTYKEVDIERRNDYEKMVRKARKLFTDVDISLLEFLDDELAYYTQHLADECGNQDLKATKKRLKLLQRRGLIYLARGLFDEDGFTAGSGWMRVYHKNDVISRIIAAYRIEDDQEALL